MSQLPLARPDAVPRSAALARGEESKRGPVAALDAKLKQAGLPGLAP